MAGACYDKYTGNVPRHVLLPGMLAEIPPSLTSLRICGENATAVAEAKEYLEQRLARAMAMDGSIKIWNE
ncbi:hypothetical protein N7G274_003337 [Stereocaulon virgatum]|uniref:Uncharacterized protein n=1 Tax=Stereocaulon virgatum TaxID=373712 RepID=A0ABR4AGU8_9LECA